MDKKPTHQVLTKIRPCPTSLYLILWLGVEADEDENGDGDEVDEEGPPVGEAEGDAEAARQHDEDRAGAQDGAHQHHDLERESGPTGCYNVRLNDPWKGTLHCTG